MNFKNPVTGEQFQLNEQEARFFEGAVSRFTQKVHWGAFENFAFKAGAPIYSRRRSFGQLVADPLYRALQDMWLQLGVDQGEVQDDRAQGEKAFWQGEARDREPAAQARRQRIAVK